MWPFRRRAANASTSGDDADGGEVLRPARADWRTVEPLRPVQAMPLSTIDRGFEQSLATRARPLFLDSLTHHVHPMAPAGVVDGLAASTRPSLAEGAVRTFAAPAVAQRITSVEAVTTPPGAPLASDPAPAVQRAPVAVDPAPVVQRTAVADATPAPPAPLANPATADGVGQPTTVRSSEAHPPDEPAAVSTGDDQEQPPSTPDEIVERPLLSERAPLTTTPADDSAPIRRLGRRINWIGVAERTGAAARRPVVADHATAGDAHRAAAAAIDGSDRRWHS